MDLLVLKGYPSCKYKEIIGLKSAHHLLRFVPFSCAIFRFFVMTEVYLNIFRVESSITILRFLFHYNYRICSCIHCKAGPCYPLGLGTDIDKYQKYHWLIPFCLMSSWYNLADSTAPATPPTPLRNPFPSVPRISGKGTPPKPPMMGWPA